MPGETSERVSRFQLLKQLAEASVILAAALFVMGWSYLFGYYRAFGLSPNEFAVPTQTVLMYAAPVMRTPMFVFVCLVSIVALGLLSQVPKVLRFLKHPAVSLVIAAVAATLLSIHASNTGRTNAHRDTYSTSSTLPYAKLEPKGISASSQFGCTTEEWGYLLLLRANGQVYVFLPLQTSEAIPMNLRVCAFPESDIAAVRLQVGVGGVR